MIGAVLVNTSPSKYLISILINFAVHWTILKITVKAISYIAKSNFCSLKEFTIQAISKGSDDTGKVHMQVEYDGSIYYGFGANTDIVTASVEAYIDCINKFKK